MKIDFQQYQSERLYAIGFKFNLKRGKQDQKKMVIVDYLIEHNSTGKVVSFKYVCQHDFCGQKILTREVQATIDIATQNGWKNEA